MPAQRRERLLEFFGQRRLHLQQRPRARVAQAQPVRVQRLPRQQVAVGRLDESRHQVAQAQQGLEQGIQSSVLDQAQQRHPRLERGLINGLAEQSLLAGKYMGPDKRSAPDVASLVYARQAEMTNQLNDILRNRNLTGEEMLNRLYGISPTLARSIKGFSDGSIAMNAKMAAGTKEWVTALATQYDPTLNPNNIAVRGVVRKSFGAGRDGQTLTSIGTAYMHLKDYYDDLQKLRDRGWTQQMIDAAVNTKNLPPWLKDKLTDPEDRALIGRLNSDEEVAMNETERALTGGKPTVSGLETIRKGSGWRGHDPETVMANIENLNKQLSQKMLQMKSRYDAYIGPKGAPAGERGLFDEYAKSGKILEDEGGDYGGKTTLSSGPQRATPESNKAVQDALRSGSLPAFAPPAPPAAPAPAAPTAPAAPGAPAAPSARPAYVPKDATDTKSVGGTTYWKDPKTGKWMGPD